MSEAKRVRFRDEQLLSRLQRRRKLYYSPGARRFRCVANYNVASSSRSPLAQSYLPEVNPLAQARPPNPPVIPHPMVRLANINGKLRFLHNRCIPPLASDGSSLLNLPLGPPATSEARVGTMSEDYCVGYGKGASCTEVQARTVFVTRYGVASSSLSSSLGLTSPYPLVQRPSYSSYRTSSPP